MTDKQRIPLIIAAAVAGAVLGRLTAPRRPRINVVHLCVQAQNEGWEEDWARAVAEADRILRGER